MKLKFQLNITQIHHSLSNGAEPLPDLSGAQLLQEHIEVRSNGTTPIYVLLIQVKYATVLILCYIYVPTQCQFKNLMIIILQNISPNETILKLTPKKSAKKK